MRVITTAGFGTVDPNPNGSSPTANWSAPPTSICGSWPRNRDWKSSGYVGGLGWDLETAVDDATIAIRDAMRVGTLATINTAFWTGKL